MGIFCMNEAEKITEEVVTSDFFRQRAELTLATDPAHDFFIKSEIAAIASSIAIFSTVMA